MGVSLEFHNKGSVDIGVNLVVGVSLEFHNRYPLAMGLNLDQGVMGISLEFHNRGLVVTGLSLELHIREVMVGCHIREVLEVNLGVIYRYMGPQHQGSFGGQPTFYNGQSNSQPNRVRFLLLSK